MQVDNAAISQGGAQYLRTHDVLRERASATAKQSWVNRRDRLGAPSTPVRPRKRGSEADPTLSVRAAAAQLAETKRKARVATFLRSQDEEVMGDAPMSDDEQVRESDNESCAAA